MFYNPLNVDSNRRRAASAVFAMVMVPVLLAMAALTVDVGVLYGTRADLQRAADAAALAGASSLTSDPMTLIRLGSDSGSALAEVEALANARSSALGALNPSFGKGTTYIEAADIQVGYLDLSSATSTLDTTPTPPAYANAVQVTVRRSAEAPNGAVEFFFAPIFGKFTTTVTASATAAFDDRVVGYDASPGWLLPFTLDRTYYETQKISGGDSFGYDEDTAAVYGDADGIREINLYPHNPAPGNFGLLNIPSTSSSDTPTIVDQIENGVAPEDMEHDFGGPVITFVNEDGNPITYTINGNPGLTASLESTLESKIGDVVAFFLHDQVVLSGSNTNFRIVDIRFGRVMRAKLTGSPHTKGLYIQPASYAGSGMRLQPGPTWGSGFIGRIVLVR